MIRSLTTAACLLLACCGETRADLKSTAARELAEYLLRKFGMEVAEQSAETLSRKIEVLVLKHGDEAVTAIRRVGPKVLLVVEEAGEHGSEAIKLMARRGDEALWVVAKKNRMAIFLKHGDEAAEAMIRQRAVAEPLIRSFGRPAAVALRTISTRNGRRLAMMADEGTLDRIGRTPEVLDVVGKYGDRAMDFIWRNKGSLAVATALAAFLADPEPFLAGTAEIARVAAENAVKPLAEVPKEVARQVNWTALACWSMLILGILMVVRLRTRRVSGPEWPARRAI